LRLLVSEFIRFPSLFSPTDRDMSDEPRKRALRTRHFRLVWPADQRVIEIKLVAHLEYHGGRFEFSTPDKTSHYKNSHVFICNLGYTDLRDDSLKNEIQAEAPRYQSNPRFLLALQKSDPGKYNNFYEDESYPVGKADSEQVSSSEQAYREHVKQRGSDEVNDKTLAILPEVPPHFVERVEKFLADVPEVQGPPIVWSGLKLAQGTAKAVLEAAIQLELNHRANNPKPANCVIS
jgi:hypothetical protein